jgi:hypothetical protein
LSPQICLSVALVVDEPVEVVSLAAAEHEPSCRRAAATAVTAFTAASKTR